MPGTPVQDPAFQDRIAHAASAANTIQDLETLLLTRFAALTQHGQITDQRGHTLDPITDVFAADGSYGSWGLAPWPSWSDALSNLDIKTDALTINYTWHLGEVSRILTSCHVPWALLALEPGPDENYQEYLRLKALYEPPHQ